MTSPEQKSEHNAPQLLSHLLEDLRVQLDAAPERLSLRDIAARLERRGIGAVMLIFALALALPSGILPGLNTLFALPLAALMGQQALGHDRVWLPRRLQDKQLNTHTFSAILRGGLPSIRRLETLLRPRLQGATRGPIARILGGCGVLIAAFASIPVPLTHTVPGFGLLLMAVGITLNDGLAIILGALLGIIYIALLITMVAFFGAHATDMIHHWLHHTATVST